MNPLVLVTGLSGAGRTSILHILEDLGYETMDNPPLARLAELAAEAPGPLAVGLSTRARGFTPSAVLAVPAQLVFATAEEAVLLRRYTETRRRHPLGENGQIHAVREGIAREAELLAPLRDAADWVVDTTDLPMPRLRLLVEARFRQEGAPGLGILVQSFAFPRGLPREADLVFDLRFLANPHYVAALRPHTGQDPAVAAFVAADPDFAGFWARLTALLDPLLPRYVAEGKKYLTVALGCSGGRHRSVFAADLLADHLRRQGWRAESAHRELHPTAQISHPLAPEASGTSP